MGKLHMPLKIIIVWVLAVFFLGDSILRSLRSNFNFGLLLVYLITGGLWIYGLFYRPIDAFCAAGAGRVLKILFFCGIGVLAALVAFVVASGYAQQPTGGERAIIVLGAGLRRDTPSDLLRRRLDAAFDAWSRDRQALVVVTGGQGRGETIPEGVAMARYLQQKGVPESQILVEQKSTSTEENLLFARELLAARGVDAGQPVAVVSNAFHCYRARGYARLVGFEEVRSVPASIGANSVLPCYLREAFAVLYYWVFKSSRAGWMARFVGTL